MSLQIAVRKHVLDLSLFYKTDMQLLVWAFIVTSISEMFTMNTEQKVAM